MVNYAGIDLGGYHVSIVGQEEGNIPSGFISWVYGEADVAYIGELAGYRCAEANDFGHLNHNFLREINHKKQDKVLAGVQVSAFGLVALLFRKAGLEQPGLKSADYLTAAVPAYFSPDQHVAVFDAARQEGLTLTAAISQGLAKAIYLLHNENFELGQVFAVYEWGATQFEFSVFRVLENKGLEVLASSSMDTVGGYACDQKYWDIVAEKYKAKRGKDLTALDFNVLSTQLISVKEEMSTARSSIGFEIKNHEISISQSEFEQRISGLLAQTIHCAESALRLAGLSTTKVDSVYLTGGSGQISSVISELKKSFGSQVFQVYEKNMAASGARLFSEYYNRSDSPAQIKELATHPSITRFNYTLYAYGLVTSVYDPELKADKDQNSVIIKKGQLLPVTEQVTFHSDEAKQDAVDLQLTYASSDTASLEDVQGQLNNRVNFIGMANALIEIKIVIHVDKNHDVTFDIKSELTPQGAQAKYQNSHLKDRIDVVPLSISVR